jgi:hypothetical protein
MLDHSGTAGGTCHEYPGALDPAWCRQMASRLDERGFSTSQDRYPAWYRSNQRQVLDDPVLAADLTQRLSYWLPSQMTDADGQVWDRVGINPRFRACRYAAGQAFPVHQDGVFHGPDHTESRLTFMVYLDEPPAFEGGDTRFFADRQGLHHTLSVQPRQGTLILFGHALWHDGAPVLHGTKRVLRSDVLYRPRTPRPVTGHRGYIWGLHALQDSHVLSFGRDGRVLTWDCRGPSPVLVAQRQAHPSSVLGATLDPEGTLWTVGRDGTLRRFGPSGGSETWPLMQGTLACLCAGPDGVWVGGSSGALVHWTAGRPPQVHGVVDGWIWSINQLPDGRLLLGTDQGARVGTPDRGFVPLGPALPVRAVAADGTSTAWLGGMDGSIAQMDLETLQPVRRSQPHRGPVTSLALTPNASEHSLLWSTGEDNAVVGSRVADLCVLREHAHGNFARGVVVLEDGRPVSAGYDGALRTWPEAA